MNRLHVAVAMLLNAVGAALRSNPTTADLVILVPAALFVVRQIVRAALPQD